MGDNQLYFSWPATEPVPEKPKLLDDVIVTNNDDFHASEVMAVAILLQLDEYKNYKVLRSRDWDVGNRCKFVLGLGEEYSHERRIYPRKMEYSMKNIDLDYDSPLSTAGIVYADYGKQLIAQIMKLDPEDENVRAVYDNVYYEQIEEIDIDRQRNKKNLAKRRGLPVRVSELLEVYREGNPDHHARFREAIEMCTKELLDVIMTNFKVWLPERSIVSEAIARRFETHPDGHIIELPKRMAFNYHIQKLESESERVNKDDKNALKKGSIKVVIYQRFESKNWAVHAVSTFNRDMTKFFRVHLTQPSNGQQHFREGYISTTNSRDEAIECALLGIKNSPDVDITSRQNECVRRKDQIEKLFRDLHYNLMEYIPFFKRNDRSSSSVFLPEEVAMEEIRRAAGRLKITL